MRICFCVDLMDSGGAERVASVLCNEFVKLSHIVNLVMISETEQKSFYPLDAKVALIPLLKDVSSKKRTFIRKIKYLKKHFKKNNYDVVISFLPNVNICVYLASFHKRSFIHIVSERNNPSTNPKNHFKRFIKEKAFKNADGIVCQTKDSEKYYLKKTNKPICVIKNPINTFSNVEHTEQTNFDIISVGRLEHQKNFELLIDTFNVFSKSHPEAKLKIYGVGSLREQLQNKINELKLDNKVFLLCNSKTWIDDNINCAMFISSSLYEGMPNALLEAVINGIPSIASDCPIGGSKEIIGNNDNGLLFHNNDLNDLVSKMELLYHNQLLINKFRKASFEIKKDYSVKIIAEKWLSFINEVSRINYGIKKDN